VIRNVEFDALHIYQLVLPPTAVSDGSGLLRAPQRQCLATAEPRGFEALGCEGREIDGARLAVEDELAHRFAARGRVEHAPDAVARRHIGALDPRHRAEERQAVLGDRPKAGLSRRDRRRREHGRDMPTGRLEPRMRARVGPDLGRIEGNLPRRRDRAHPSDIGARKDLGGQDFAARLAILEEQGLGRNPVAGVEHQAVALIA